ncbi:hypothetical protein LXL04_028331 [Taraxacum kok-saghyz]
MDRIHWMYRLKRSDDRYLARLVGFLKAAEENRVKNEESYIWCPCVDCKNCQKSVYVKVEEHLIFRGFMPDYTCWSIHGEIMVGHNETSNIQRPAVRLAHSNSSVHTTNILHVWMIFLKFMREIV